MPSSTTYYCNVSLRLIKWDAREETQDRAARSAGESYAFASSGSTPINVFGVTSLEGSTSIRMNGVTVTDKRGNDFIHWLAEKPSDEEYEQLMLEGAGNCYAKITGDLQKPNVEIITAQEFSKVDNPTLLFAENLFDENGRPYKDAYKPSVSDEQSSQQLSQQQI